MDDLCLRPRALSASYSGASRLWVRSESRLSVERYYRYALSLVVRGLSGTLILLAACVGVKAILVETFCVSSGSMTPTLHVDAHLVVNKVAYGLRTPFSAAPLIQWSAPERGEIVVFRRPDDRATSNDESSRSMVKRVVGVAGDSVLISSDGVRVNGRVVVEPYAQSRKASQVPQQSFQVPPDSVFLLGDNRDESFDSRFWQQPFIRTENLIGSVAVVY